MVDDDLDIPNSDMVPPGHHNCTPILRLAHWFHLRHPRIAYLCVHAAREMSFRVDPCNWMYDVLKFRRSLKMWIDENDETSEQGKFQPNTDLPYLQSFSLDYYEKNIVSVIKMLANQYFKAIDPSASASVPTLQAVSPPDVKASSSPLDGLIHTCKTALVLFDCLELLSKDVQLPSQILEIHTDLKNLVTIFKPYDRIPVALYRPNHPPIKTLPELQAAVDLLTYRHEAIIKSRRGAYNPGSAHVRGRPAFEMSKPEAEELRMPLFLFHFVLFSLLFVTWYCLVVEAVSDEVALWLVLMATAVVFLLNIFPV